jgi:hypothetical protein
VIRSQRRHCSVLLKHFLRESCHAEGCTSRQIREIRTCQLITGDVESTEAFETLDFWREDGDDLPTAALASYSTRTSITHNMTIRERKHPVDYETLPHRVDRVTLLARQSSASLLSESTAAGTDGSMLS